LRRLSGSSMRCSVRDRCNLHRYRLRSFVSKPQRLPNGLFLENRCACLTKRLLSRRRSVVLGIGRQGRQRRSDHGFVCRAACRGLLAARAEGFLRPTALTAIRLRAAPAFVQSHRTAQRRPNSARGEECVHRRTGRHSKLFPGCVLGTYEKPKAKKVAIASGDTEAATVWPLRRQPQDPLHRSKPRCVPLSLCFCLLSKRLVLAETFADDLCPHGGPLHRCSGRAFVGGF
jgi:hypothetical protein